MRQQIYIAFIVLSSMIYLGCATPPIGRDASEYLLTTDRDAQSLLKDLRINLEKNKYKIRKEDSAAGLLVTAPRKFSFQKAGAKVNAKQTINIRQEGGSLKLRIMYDCNYAGDGLTFEACYVEDAEATAKIGRIEPALLETIRPLLMKHGGAKEDAAGFEDEWGGPENSSEATNK